MRLAGLYFVKYVKFRVSDVDVTADVPSGKNGKGRSQKYVQKNLGLHVLIVKMQLIVCGLSQTPNRVQIANHPSRKMRAAII